MSLKDDYRILDAQLDLLGKHDVKDIVLAIGHLGDEINQFVDYRINQGKHAGCTFRTSTEFEPLGTGGAILQAWQKHCQDDQSVVVLNGDVYAPELNIRKLIDAVRPTPDPWPWNMSGSLAMKSYIVPFGTLATGLPFTHDDHLYAVYDFVEKKPVFINAGVYYLRFDLLRDSLSQFNGVPCSIERDIFPQWKDRLYGVVYDGPWFDLGTPESLEESRRFVAAHKE